jgi:class 3 adenylate cyclase
MIRELKKIKGDMYCNIGVSTGECFAGVVGTSGSRKEFSVLGDIVNLAARIILHMKL